MLEGFAPPNRHRPCKVRDLLETLEPKDQEILEKALADSAWGIKTLSKALSERGVQISETPLTKHRTGRCSCA